MLIMMINVQVHSVFL